MNLQQLDVKGNVATVMFNNSNTNNVVSSVADFHKENLELLRSPGFRLYLKFVDQLFPGKADILRHCGFVGNKYQGELSGKVGFHPRMCKEIDLDPKCAQNYTSSIVEDSYDLFRSIANAWGIQKGEDLYLFNDVFTIPQDLQGKITDKDIRHEIGRYYRAMYGGMPAIVCNTQTWHSKNPLSDEYLHIHADGISLFYSVDRGFYSVDPFIDLKKSQNIWKQCILRLADKVSMDLPGIEKVNLHHQYTPFDDDQDHIKRIKHSLYYDMRKPVIDVVKYFINASENNISITENDLKNMYRLLSDKHNKKEKVWIGWLGDSVKNKYLSMLGLHVKTDVEIKMEEKEIEMEDKFIHPITKEIMVRVGENVHIDDIPRDAVILTWKDRVGSDKLFRSKIVQAYVKKSSSVEMEYKRFERVP